MNNKQPLPQKKDAILGILGALIVLSFAIMCFTSPVKADPAGATVTFNSTATSAAYTPGNRTDAGGTINTLQLSTVQQDDKWKAYVGNVSGSLTLDDANGYTIYRWALVSSEVSGEIYISRASNVGWSTINCSTEPVIATEHTFLGMSYSSVDNINKTFNSTTHPALTIAGRTLSQNTCKSMATYVNDTEQNMATADFPEVLLESGTDLVFVSPLNQGSLSYRDGALVDFQIMVPDDVTIASTLYYFYVELGS